MVRRLIFLATLLAPIQGFGYPIPLGSDAELNVVANGFAKQNPSQLSEATLTRILVGSDKPIEQSAASWRKSLSEAIEKDALFEVETAESLRREIETSYEISPTLNYDLIQLRAQAGHDRVSSLLAEGKKLQAIDVARETLRRFRDIKLDRKRHPPNVIQFFEQALETILKQTEGEIVIQGKISGILYADGNRLGPIEAQKRYKLPYGSYRLWVRDGPTTTLARAVRISSESQVIAFNEILDPALQVLPHHHLACSNNCEAILGMFAKRLGTTSLTGVRRAAEGNGLYEVIRVTQNANVLEKTLINRHGLTVQLAAPALAQAQNPPTDHAGKDSSFSALWLIPAGGGQFAQGRWGWGIAWASLEAGLLAWNIHAATSYYSAEPGSQARKSAENQAKISGGVLYTTIAVGIAEAIITGLLTEPKAE